jgi:hypothetical protein
MAEFLKATGLRIDAARYYIALGLLAPSKHNGKFVFSPSDVRDANDLQTLLHLGASLQESKPILFEARVSGEPFFKKRDFPGFIAPASSPGKKPKGPRAKTGRGFGFLCGFSSDGTGLTGVPSIGLVLSI